MDRSKLRNELIRDEGLKLTAYQDINGFWTIGVGHLLGTERRMVSITVQEADALLDYDVSVALEAVKRVFPKANLDGNFPRISDVRLRALVNMMFNRGEARMRESTSITPAIRVAIQTDAVTSWAQVAVAIMTSPWAKQVGDRAHRLALMLGTGVTA